jgi:phenylacetate-CoA ligase
MAQSVVNPLESQVFTERVAFLLESQYWSREKLESLQLSKLRHLARHVQAHVPFYRDVMASENFTWEDMRSLSDVRRFPRIDKRLIQDNHDAFIADHADRSKLIARTTGGSTGTPLTVYADEDFVARDKANTEYYMRALGLDIFHYRSVRLYGDKIDDALADKGVYWYETEGRKLVMSCYHISSDTAPAYVDKINEFAPAYIHTRPSSILPLANYIMRGDLELKAPVRLIVCDGECLTDGQRRTIECAFQARLANIFGHTEGCAVGHPCAHSEHLHFMPQVGLVEIVDRYGDALATPGDRGEMVVSGFNNLVFPLIRYRTGDIGVLGEPSCPCGRTYPILSNIEGRIQDYVVDREGNVVPLAPAVFNYNDMDWKGIREFKVRQERPGELVIDILPERNGLAQTDASRHSIEDRIGAILGKAFTVRATFVDAIPKTRLGKHRYLNQKLDLSEFFST